MRRIFICLLLLLMSSTAFGTVDLTQINQSNVQAGNFDQTLRGWIDTLNTDITNASGLFNLGSATVFYVDSGQGNASTVTGKSVGNAFPTLDDVFDSGNAKANRFDIAFVLPGHNEGGADSAIFDADVAGVYVIGLGKGALKPTFDLDGATATCAVGADSVTLINLRFRASTTTVKGEIAQNDLTRALTVDAGADDAHIISCDFGFKESSGDEFLYALVIGAATGTVVEDCFFDSGEEAAAAAIVLAGSDLTILRNNKIYGDYTVACIHSATTTNTRLAYSHNKLWNGVHSGLNAKPVVSLKATDTGFSEDNDAYCNVATVGAAFVGTKIFHKANYYSEDEAGTKTAFPFDNASTTGGTGTSITMSGDD